MRLSCGTQSMDVFAVTLKEALSSLARGQTNRVWVEKWGLGGQKKHWAHNKDFRKYWRGVTWDVEMELCRLMIDPFWSPSAQWTGSQCRIEKRGWRWFWKWPGTLIFADLHWEEFWRKWTHCWGSESAQIQHELCSFELSERLHSPASWWTWSMEWSFHRWNQHNPHQVHRIFYGPPVRHEPLRLQLHSQRERNCSQLDTLILLWQHSHLHCVQIGICSSWCNSLQRLPFLATLAIPQPPSAPYRSGAPIGPETAAPPRVHPTPPVPKAKGRWHQGIPRPIARRWPWRLADLSVCVLCVRHGQVSSNQHVSATCNEVGQGPCLSKDVRKPGAKSVARLGQNPFPKHASVRSPFAVPKDSIPKPLARMKAIHGFTSLKHGSKTDSKKKTPRLRC